MSDEQEAARLRAVQCNCASEYFDKTKLFLSIPVSTLPPATLTLVDAKLQLREAFFVSQPVLTRAANAISVTKEIWRRV